MTMNAFRDLVSAAQHAKSRRYPWYSDDNPFGIHDGVENDRWVCFPDGRGALKFRVYAIGDPHASAAFRFPTDALEWMATR